MSKKIDNAIGLYLDGIRDGDTTAIERSQAIDTPNTTRM